MSFNSTLFAPFITAYSRPAANYTSFCSSATILLLLYLLTLRFPRTLRWWCLPLLTLFSTRTMQSIPDGYFTSSGYNHTINTTILIVYMNVIDVLFLAPHMSKNVDAALDAVNPSKSWKGAWKPIFDRRLTSQRVPNVLTNEKEKRDGNVPKYSKGEKIRAGCEVKLSDSEARNRFLRTQLCSVMIIYIVMVIYFELDIPSVFNPPIDRFQIYPYHSSLVRRLLFHHLRIGFIAPPRNSTPIQIHELRHRISTTIAVNFEEYTHLAGLYCCFSILFVCLFRIDEPEEWPGLWGPVSSTTTVRRFWREFNHRLAYRSLVSWAKFVLHGLLRLPEPHFTQECDRTMQTWRWNPLAYRSILTVLIFVISGAMHVCEEWFAGDCNIKITMWAFFMQPLAILVEEVVQYLAWKSGLTKRMGTSQRKVVGHLWVVAWISWIQATRIYRHYWCHNPNENGKG